MAANLGFDEVLAGLASMGFELTDCQEAIDAGHTSIETAVEWLVKRKSTPIAHDSGHTEDHENISFASVKPNTATEMESDPQVSSRYAMTEETRQAKDNFFKKERENARLEAKKRKLEEKKAKEQIRKQIADDKEMRKLRGTPKPVSPTSTTFEAMPATGNKSDFQICMLQLRLPGGHVKKASIEADTNLEDAILSVCTDSSIRKGEMEVIQPFPHKVFTKEELASTLRAVGLYPSGSLVIRKVQQPASSSTEKSSRDDGIESSLQEVSAPVHPPLEQGTHEPEEVDMVAQPHPLPVPHNHPAAIPGHDDDDHHHDDDNDDDFDIPAPIPEHLPLFPGIQRHQWGEGVRLGEVQPNYVAPPRPGAEQAQIQEDSAARRAEMRANILQRLSGPASQQEEPLLLHRAITRLEELCVNNVCRRLAGHPHLQPLATLGVLPHGICDKLISQLIKDKSLNPKTVHAFLSCCLRYIKLDCYLLVTNELLSALRFHKHLTHLSLKSCPIITDKAIDAVAVLKRLQCLNISQCTQLTDKCFKYLKDLPSLSVLQMDNTKVTDSGVTYFLSHAACMPHLTHLSLCSTAVGDGSLQALKGLTSLQILGLENTKITSLDVVQHLKHLESLSVAHTGVSNVSLAALHGHPTLSSLNILATGINDEGLCHLQGLALNMLKLPGRLNITDQGLHAIQGLPLVSLDLSDYINVTDRGVAEIGHMTSLIKLTLSNTRLTDEGMTHLTGLMRLTELNVDRTTVTDQGCEVLANFPQLQVLSLSSTQISDKLLRRKILNQCIQLSKLNLSRTRVSNRGIKHLILYSLTLLNLDWTRVSTDCKLLLTGCPLLKALRTNNCTPPRPGDSSDSEEEQD